MNRGDLVTVDGWTGGPYRFHALDGEYAHLLTLTGSDWYAPLSRVRPVPAKARATDPDTSHLAAQRAASHAAGDRATVLRLLAEHGPLTDFDLARLTGIKQTSIGVRRGELRDAGLVEAVDRAGVSDTGSPCIRWTLTEAGRGAA